MVLDIKNIFKRYKDVVALNDFSLHMENGLYGFLGENGAGKSTLIKILSCNLVQDEGVILADGKDIRLNPEEYRKRIGYMPQESVGYPGMRVQEFMEYMAVLKGLSLKEPSVKEQILRLLRQVHLEEHMKKKFSQLSGGMKRRLLFAQAVLGNPSLLILDEPTAGLDPNERIAMRNLIAKEALDRIVILATHIISDVECVADEIVLMKKGQLVGCKTPEVWLDDVKPYVREFVCKPGEIEKIQEDYVVSNMRQCQEGISIRVIGEKFDGNIFKLAETLPTLDDVYLYFASV